MATGGKGFAVAAFTQPPILRLSEILVYMNEFP